MSDEVAIQTKLALRRLAKSVAVITTFWQGRRYAMAATAVEGLSLDPPSMLLCIAKTASLAEALAAETPFAINLLARHQEGISARGGAPWQGEERFALGQWSNEETAPPVLLDAQASFICTPASQMEYGTHLIVVGKIDEVLIAGEVDPLIYVNGRYGGVAATEPVDA